MIFEDGLQSRDFVHISDIVQANMLALEKEEANYQVFNVGTGRNISILDVACTLIKKLNPRIKPIIVNKFREGDIRHCYADISKIKRMLGFKPRVSFESGSNDLINWVRTERAVSRVDKAVNELSIRGLMN
jgi:dTDP-L-rhamnose 4-epimerase